ncbi:hypothetical protein [Planktosalinus lacus]|nr:hypothetical protein [Planktosalinus lacus]
MNYLLTFLLVLSFFTAASQNNVEDLYVKNNIEKVIIKGFEYKKGSLVKQSHLVHELDKQGKTVLFTSYDTKDSLIRQTTHTFSEDGMTEYREKKDKDGHLQHSAIVVRNKKDRSFRKVQLDAKGDTLIEQLLIRNHNMNDSILYRVIKGQRYLTHKWEVDDEGKLISKKRYHVSGSLLESDSYTYIKKGNCIITENKRKEVIAEICTEGNKEISKILQDREGYRSGIKLVYEKGGESIETKLANGLIDKIEYFSKKGKLLASIQYTYLSN